MQQGERIIVKLDPDYNPTGKPMPDKLLEEIKADPGFSKLSYIEQKKVVKKVSSMIESVEDVAKYGTLKEKFEKIVEYKEFTLNAMELPYIVMTVDGNEEKTFDSNSVSRLKEGSIFDNGEVVLKLVACDEIDMGKGFMGEIFSSISDVIPNAVDAKPKQPVIKDVFEVADIQAPITGKVFSLCEMKTSYKTVRWNDDLFIVSSVPDDTRKAAIKWYKETTGKTPKYHTEDDLKEQSEEENKNVDAFLSKWDL